MESELNNITKEDVIQAIARIDENLNLIQGRKSFKYNLLYNNEIYPPILVLSQASELKGGKAITLRSMGENTDKAFAHLTKLGFEIAPIKEGEFTWVPFFKELAQYVIKQEDSQEELIALLHKLEFDKNLEDVDATGKVPLTEIDPFTFFAFLMKIKNSEKRKLVSRKLKQFLQLSVPSPDDFDGVPSAQPMALWFFPYKKDRSFEIATLWQLARQVLDGKIENETFQKALSINSVAAAKLTQGMFWLNPETFFPIDGQSKPYLENNGINPNFSSSDEYMKILDQVKAKFKVPFSRLSYDAWAENQKETPINKDAKWFELASVIKKINNPSAVNKFFDLTKKVLKAHKLKSEDQRTYAATPTADRIHLTIGRRYVTMLEGKGQDCRIGFIAETDKLEKFKGKYSSASKISPYSSNNKVLGTWAEVNFNEIKVNDIADTVVKASKKELQIKKSQYRERNKQLHNPWIFAVASDKKIRQQLMSEDFKDEIVSEENMQSKEYPLNQILYGPPGTGKTYNTINKALELCGVEIGGLPRAAVKELFNKKVNEGQVVFTTFHQSMTYEDFIEGIKPQEPEKEGDPVIYRIEDGIFKRLAIEASFAIAKAGSTKETESVLDFSLAYNHFIQDLEESLAAEDAVELTTKNGGKVQVEGVSSQGNILIKHRGGSRIYTVSKNRLSKLEQAIDDLAEINNINDQFRAIIGGSNSSAYWAVLNAIKKAKKAKATSPSDRLYTLEEKKEVVAALNKDDYKGKTGKPYVLVIDEINRGNVSQIFGELITLIEEDKRLGKEEALDVMLPYSKEPFGVPPNLHIIGTMNTADRSIEALDTALRRRFSFIEMPADPELIKKAGKLKDAGGVIEGIDLTTLLATINKRIIKLIDKDHTIGHSHFLSVGSTDELKLVFKNKIIPLLQEYFFGDYGKIGLILGDSFITRIDDQEMDFAAFEVYDGGVISDLKERAVYEIKSPAEWNFISVYQPNKAN